MAENLDALLRSIWGERSQGLDLPVLDWNRPITHQEVLYLLQIYPFLQITSSNPVWADTVVPQFHRQPSGWVIHDYDQAMSVSPEEYLFGPHSAPFSEGVGSEEDTGTSGTGEGGSGGGTIVRQSFDTVQGMIALAQEKGWPGIDIIAGTDFMKWSAWMAAQDLGLPLIGYEPTAREKEKRERIQKFRTERPLQKKPVLGSGE